MIKQYDEKTLSKLKAVEVSILRDIIRVCNEHGIKCFLSFGSLIGAIRHHGFIPWDDDMDISMFREDYEKFISIFDAELGDKYDLMTPLREKGFASTVIKVEKRGTTFIPRHSIAMKCRQGIFVDIFVYDKVSSDEKQYRRQAKKARFLSMLMFLAGSPSPEININGIAGKAAKLICLCVHYMLRLCPGVKVLIYKKFEKNSIKANDEKNSVYTMYQDTEPDGCIADISDILPLKEVMFEDIKVNIPKNYDYILTKRYGNYMELPPENERVNHAAAVIDFGEV